MSHKLEEPIRLNIIILARLYRNIYIVLYPESINFKMKNLYSTKYYYRSVNIGVQLMEFFIYIINCYGYLHIMF